MDEIGISFTTDSSLDDNFPKFPEIQTVLDDPTRVIFTTNMTEKDLREKKWEPENIRLLVGAIIDYDVFSYEMDVALRITKFFFDKSLIKKEVQCQNIAT